MLLPLAVCIAAFSLAQQKNLLLKNASFTLYVMYFQWIILLVRSSYSDIVLSVLLKLYKQKIIH